MKSNLFIVLAVCWGAYGCVVESEDPEIINAPKLAGNGLNPSTLATSSANGPLLNANPIDANNLASMGASEQARDVLKYAVYCALPDGQSATFTVGSSYTYPGHLGLAPAWKTTALTTAQRSALSACILALSNNSGVSVAVSMRGFGLALDAGESTNYMLQEGAYWGDLFAGKNWWASACMGDATVYYDDWYQALILRECSEDDGSGKSPCGFKATGECATRCTTFNATSGFSGCTDGVHASSSSVMTVYVSDQY